MTIEYESFWDKGPQYSTPQQSAGGDISYKEISSPWEYQNKLKSNLTIKQCFDFARFIYVHDPLYQQAIQRVVSYFLTDLEYTDPSDTGELKQDEITRYKNTLEDTLNIKQLLRSVMTDFCVYGNVFISLIPPVYRKLECPSCGLIHPIGVIASEENNFDFKFNASDVSFEARCASCGYKGVWKEFSTRGDFEQDVLVQRWNPYEMLIDSCPFSGVRTYAWSVNGKVKDAISKGHLKYISNAPISLIKAASKGMKYEFSNEVIYHMKEDDIMDIGDGTWGIPKNIYSYGLSRYVFHLRKMNEAVTGDYIVPFRTIGPAKSETAVNTYDTGPLVDEFSRQRQLKGLIAEHSKDPTVIGVTDFAVDYNIFGGEASNLAPVDLIEKGEDAQLNALGVPPAFYRANLELQTAPMMARLFQSQWQHLVSETNKLIRWIVNKFIDELGWKPIEVKLREPKIADSLDRLTLLMQLMQSQSVSKDTLLNEIGLEHKEELRKQYDEAKEEALMEQKSQKEMDKLVTGGNYVNEVLQAEQAAQQEAMAAQGGSQPPMGAPGNLVSQGSTNPIGDYMTRIQKYSNPSMPVPIQELLSVAQEGASILMNMPTREVRQSLRDIRQINDGLARFIETFLPDARKQQTEQAAQQVLGQ